MVTPWAKSEPLAGVQAVFVTVQSLAAVTVKETTVPAGPAHSLVMLPDVAVMVNAGKTTSPTAALSLKS